MLAGLGLHCDLFGLDVEDLGQSPAHGPVVWGQLGPLGENDAVDVADPPPGLSSGLPGRIEHLGRVPIAVGRVGVGKNLADVAQGGRAEHGVAHGVQQHVGIAVAQQSAVVGNVDPTQPQRPAGLEPMGVVSDSDADG